MKKLALVTGGASGLGFAFAELLAKDAYDLILIDVDSDKLNKAVEILQNEYSVTVKTIEADLGKKDAAQNIYKLMGPGVPDVLINNAGFGLRGEFISTDWGLEEKMVNLHVLTTTLLTKLVANEMVKRGSGKIIIVSSLSALLPGPFMAIYYATKSYLLSFGRALSSELKGSGVTVTTICPGVTLTNFARTVELNSKSGPFRKGFFADSSEYVARVSYKAMQHGRSYFIPGYKSRLLKFLIWLMPQNISISSVRKKQFASMQEPAVLGGD